MALLFQSVFWQSVVGLSPAPLPLQNRNTAPASLAKPPRPVPAPHIRPEAVQALYVSEDKEAAPEVDPANDVNTVDDQEDLAAMGHSKVNVKQSEDDIVLEDALSAADSIGSQRQPASLLQTSDVGSKNEQHRHHLGHGLLRREEHHSTSDEAMWHNEREPDIGAMAHAAARAFGGRVDGDAATSAVATAAALLDSRASNPSEGASLIAVGRVDEQSPGNVDGWVQERGKCTRKGKNAAVKAEVKKGNEAKSVKDCAKKCHDDKSCAAFEVSGEEAEAGDVKCNYFAGIHVGDGGVGDYCYLSRKWAERAGELKKAEPPTPSPAEQEKLKLANASIPHGAAGPRGPPGKDGKNHAGTHEVPIIIVAMLVNISISAYLFMTLFKQVDGASKDEPVDDGHKAAEAEDASSTQADKDDH